MKHTFFWLTRKLMRKQKLRTLTIFLGILFSTFLLSSFGGDFGLPVTCWHLLGLIPMGAHYCSIHRGSGNHFKCNRYPYEYFRYICKKTKFLSGEKVHQQDSLSDRIIKNNLSICKKQSQIFVTTVFLQIDTVNLFNYL